MTHGTIQSWDVEVGAQVEEGDQIASMETDKATMALESPDSGYVAKILVPAGTKDIPVKDVICVLAEEKDDIEAFADFTLSETPGHAGDSQPVQTGQPNAPISQAPVTPQPTSTTGFIRASPMARRLAKERGVNLKNIISTKGDGIIRKDDVLTHQQSPTPVPSQQPTGESNYIDIPLTNIRKVISSRLLQSKQDIPHYYLTVQVNMDESMSLRNKLNPSSPSRLSINDLVIKASALACIKYPEVNSSFRDGFIRQFNHVDVSVAVNTEDGLLTPIVFGAQALGLTSISEKVKSLAEKAKEKKLKPEEFQGGTFTISNLGMFGIDQFCAIINPPQSSILAVGTIKKGVVADEAMECGYKLGNLMNVTLSCDHRVVDGAVGAQWLAYFKKLMEKPELMLL